MVEGLTKVYYPQASATVIFVIMVIVLLARPAGLFGKGADMSATTQVHQRPAPRDVPLSGFSTAQASRS